MIRDGYSVRELTCYLIAPPSPRRTRDGFEPTTFNLEVAVPYASGTTRELMSGFEPPTFTLAR